MKKILSAVLLVAIWATMAFGAGTISQGAVQTVCGSDAQGHLCFKTLTFTCTADSSDGSYPSTGNAVTTDANAAELKGWYLYMMSTVPGSTAPTNGYTVKINTASGVDALGGAGATRTSATTGDQVQPLIDITRYISGPRPIDGALTLVITGNSVNSAVTTVKLFFMK